jgi:hypothetical protein
VSVALDLADSHTDCQGGGRYERAVESAPGDRALSIEEIVVGHRCSCVGESPKMRPSLSAVCVMTGPRRSALIGSAWVLLGHSLIRAAAVQSQLACDSFFRTCIGFQIAAVHELEPKTTFDA